jgi:peptidylglycine monooxygenase
MLADRTPDDGVYLVDRDGHQVVGARQREILFPCWAGRNAALPSVQSPLRCRIRPGGDIYVADGYGNSLVHRFTSEGVLIRSSEGAG